MADIKRLHYFDHQFLVEADFTDEQTYHLDMRRRHNRVLHTFGVAEGLQVEKTGDKEVTVGAGTAVDREGREMVLDADQIIDLSTFSSGDIYITIAYDEQETDPTTATGATGNTRVTETPQIQAINVPPSSPPPGDGSVIRLANFTLDGSGNVPGNNGDTFDAGLRQFAGSSLAPGSVDTNELADGAVTETRLANNAVSTRTIEDGAVTGDKIADNAITAAKITDLSISAADLANDSISESKLDAATRGKLVTNGDSHDHSGGDGGQIGHSALNKDDGTNPHATTATDIDTQGGTNRIVARINAGSGLVNQARIDAAIARDSEVNARFSVTTGHDHDGADSKRISPTDLNGVNASVSAANLNTLTGGATTSASALHYHQSIPTQTKIYTINFPLLEYGGNPRFTSGHYSVRCPAGQRCWGVAPVYLPPGHVIKRMGAHTKSSSAFSMRVWLVYSDVIYTSGTSVQLMTVTSAGYNETTFNATIQPSRNYIVWVYMNAAPAANVDVTGIFLEYQYSTL